jgi:Cysteine-rich CPCC
MEKSNIIFNKHTCPGCGFPALNGKSDYETCIICLWEDCGLDDKTDTLICPPNYQSLVEHRINITRFFREFTLKNGWQITTEQLIRNIKAFELDIKEGKVNLDSDSFENNLKKIVFRV